MAYANGFDYETSGPSPDCTAEKDPEPCILVIFGATGDLTARKIIPAVQDLHQAGGLPEQFALVGASRTDLSDEEFRERMRESLEQHGDAGAEMDWLLARLFYVSLDFRDAESFTALGTHLEEIRQERSLPGNTLYYLAVPPSAYEDIATNLGRAGLATEEDGYARLVVEKPFGHDLASAQALDKAIHEFFQEHQVFRIDHYLAKETVQSLLLFRFANAIFEPIWNRRYIDYIHITAAETLGVEHRAGYYESAGVLRDMFQNHMMQLLSLCAMEPPSVFDADRVRDEKTKVYRAMRPFPTERLDEYLVLGQYAAGVVAGEKVVSYVDEHEVAPDSITPTYATMKVHVDNWRWQGVPFYLTSGKRLAEKRTEIAVQFKEVPFSVFRQVIGEHISANRLVLGIQPKEEITLSFQTKLPGPLCLRTVTMHFDYFAGVDGARQDAYAKILKDVMLGDHTLFWRQDGVELCWGFLTPILMECDCPEQGERIFLYKAGSWGPQAAGKLLPKAEWENHE